jgi:predicted nucleic acid-binding Zn finger protein
MHVELLKAVFHTAIYINSNDIYILNKYFCDGFDYIMHTIKPLYDDYLVTGVLLVENI